MKGTKKIKYRGKKSEVLESIYFNDVEIKSLKHGNTGNVLYQFPSKAHNWEKCWTMDLQTAKSGIVKHQEYLANGEDNSE
jgi:hypothetical protein